MSHHWITAQAVLAIHAELLSEHGGSAGMRDAARLESAVARPRLLASEGTPDLFELAAAYALDIASGHPFTDGNKRTAYVVCMLFLRLHGESCHASLRDRVLVFERLARGEVAQDALAAWLRRWRVSGGGQAE